MANDESAVALSELADGASFWRRRRSWPADFHNSDYRRWSTENPHGQFSLDWWAPFLKTLQLWIATRPFSGEVLTGRFREAIPALSEAWQTACEPIGDDDIAMVTWEQVEAFPRVVGTIKPTRAPSPVFTSKFCHFLLPRIFPVVDNEAMGNVWATYEQYFHVVQHEWATTGSGVRDELTSKLTEMIRETGADVFDGFPTVNKIVELRLIGRRHGERA